MRRGGEIATVLKNGQDSAQNVLLFLPTAETYMSSSTIISKTEYSRCEGPCHSTYNLCIEKKGLSF